MSTGRLNRIAETHRQALRRLRVNRKTRQLQKLNPTSLGQQEKNPGKVMIRARRKTRFCPDLHFIPYPFCSIPLKADSKFCFLSVYVQPGRALGATEKLTPCRIRSGRVTRHSEKANAERPERDQER